MTDYKTGTRVVIVDTNYDIKLDSFLANGCKGVITHVEPRDIMPALYIVEMDDDVNKGEWCFWHKQIEDVK